MAGNGAEALRNSSGALRCFVGVLFVFGPFHDMFGRIDNLIALPEGHEINRNIVMQQAAGTKVLQNVWSAANQRLAGKYKTDYDLLG